jgi:O-antigen ligase
MSEATATEQRGIPSAALRVEGVLGNAALAVVILSPLPLGSDRPLWWTLLAVLIGLLVAAYAGELALLRRAPPLPVASLMGILLPYLAMLFWAFFQTLSVAPESLWHPLWENAGNVLGGKLAGAISVNPEESLIGILRLTTYAGVFWLFVQLGRDRSFAERTLRVLAYGGFCYALYGLSMHILGIKRILWIAKWAYLESVTSTFINRNSYATYAALGLLCAGALVFDRIRDILSMSASLRRKAKRLIAILASGGLLPLIAAAVLAMALLQTGSRAGTLSAFVGIFVFMVAAAYADLLRWRQAVLSILVLCGAGLMLVGISGGGMVERLDVLDTDESARRAIYELTLRAIGDAPLLGTGLGTFPEIFTIYRSETFETFRTISEAHNSYLENALELGVPATVLLVGAFAAIAEANIVALRRRRRGRLFPALGLASLATVGVHATVDFSLEIPAVAATYAALAGVACAQSFRSRKARRQRTRNGNSPLGTTSGRISPAA